MFFQASCANVYVKIHKIEIEIEIEHNASTFCVKYFPRPQFYKRKILILYFLFCTLAILFNLHQIYKLEMAHIHTYVEHTVAQS